MSTLRLQREAPCMCDLPPENWCPLNLGRWIGKVGLRGPLIGSQVVAARELDTPRCSRTTVRYAASSHGVTSGGCSEPPDPALVDGGDRALAPPRDDDRAVRWPTATPKAAHSRAARPRLGADGHALSLPQGALETSACDQGNRVTLCREALRARCQCHRSHLEELG